MLNINLLLDLANVVAWSIVYLVAIVIGVSRKVWAIPKLAICQNLAWEFWVVLHRLVNDAIDWAFYCQITWLVLDIGVFATLISNDKTRPYQVINNIALLLLITVAMYIFAYYCDLWEISAFCINAVMSIAFLVRTYTDHTLWTSITIATAKLVGTLAATILNGIILWNPLILWLGGLCLICDVFYLSRLMKSQGVDCNYE